jgi:hypothetical protein
LAADTDPPRRDRPTVPEPAPEPGPRPFVRWLSRIVFALLGLVLVGPVVVAVVLWVVVKKQSGADEGEILCSAVTFMLVLAGFFLVRHLINKIFDK